VGGSTTSFEEHGVAQPSFADVCVGDPVKAVGTVSTSGVIASEVIITPPRSHTASGVVGSVDGTTTTGTCGTAGSAGQFALAAKSTDYTVEVGATTTAFKDHGVTEPSFADVCVGDQVRAVGPVSSGNVIGATTVVVTPPHFPPVLGVVGSVDGTTTTGTCGTAGSAGQFTLAAKSADYTVEVGATTTAFKDHGVTEPSFADVCVGDQVRAVGPVSSAEILTAARVTVIPPRVRTVSGTVASLNGTTIPGTCGTAQSPGEFALAAKRTTDTVEVGSTTTAFKDQAVTEPSFADVCVGDQVRATGPVSAGLVRALRVTVVPPRPHKTSGTVASVNGASTTKTCGSANTAGDFTVSAQGVTYSVDVGASKTTFKEHGVTEPSFDIVCVGDQVTTLGTLSPGNVVSATKVIVTLPSGSSTTRTSAGT
jgi:hypothetical protein